MRTAITILIVVIVILTALSAYFFIRARRQGKGYLASGTIAAMIAVWTGYVGILRMDFPTIIVAFLLREAPDKLSEFVEPSWVVVVSSTILAAWITWTIYKFGIAELAGNRIPMSASSMQYYEMGRNPSILELAFANIRFMLRGKADYPVTNPGEDPYALPLPVQAVEWASLSADLLAQYDPSLDRESYRLLEGRKLYIMTRFDPIYDKVKQRWIVMPVPGGIPDNDLMTALKRELPAHKITDDMAQIIICVQSGAARNDIVGNLMGVDIRIISEGSLLEYSLDLTHYISSIFTRFRVRPIPGTEYTLSECFVEPKVKKINYIGTEDTLSSSVASSDLLTILREWEAKPNSSHISLIGEFGQGKSTALLAYCAEWAERWMSGDRSGRIPLLIELRGKSPKRQSPDAFLGEWGQRHRLNGDALFNLVRSGRALLIFEGFDEIQEAGMKFERFQQFKALWDLSFPNGRVIFTGRPNFFLDTHEMTQLLKGSSVERNTDLASSILYALEFMDVTAIGQALRKTDQETKCEIIERCKADRNFFDIAKRPSMLPIIANQWSIIRSDLQSHHGVTSAQIIKNFIEFLYGRKESDADRLGHFQLLHRDVRHFFTRRIAWRMAIMGNSNTIDVNSFNREIEDTYDLLDAQFRTSQDSSEEIANSIRHLRAKFESRPRAELIAAIATDVRTYSLLVPDPAGGHGNLYFPHKQYFEYLLGEIFWLRETGLRTGWEAGIQANSMAKVLKSESVAILFASGLWDLEVLLSSVKEYAYIKFARIIDGYILSFSLIIILIPYKLFNYIGVFTDKNIYNLRIKTIKEILNVPVRFRLFVERSIDYNNLGFNPWRDSIKISFIILSMLSASFSSSYFAFNNREFIDSLDNSLNTDSLDSLFQMSGGDHSLYFTNLIFLFFSMSLMFLIFHYWVSSEDDNVDLPLCGLAMEMYRFGEIRSLGDWEGGKAPELLVDAIQRRLMVRSSFLTAQTGIK